MREVRGANPLHPDEAVGEMDAGERHAGGSDSVHRAGQGRSYICHAGRGSNPRQEETGRESFL